MPIVEMRRFVQAENDLDNPQIDFSEFNAFPQAPSLFGEYRPHFF